MSDREMDTGGSGWTASLIACALILVGHPAWAKGPTLTGLFPAGASRGQSVSVAANGKFDHWPATCWVDGRGVSIRPEPEKGKLSVTVADDAEPGVRWVRFSDEEGATALRPFLVGTLPEVIEVEPNDDPSSPQRVEPPSATINGRLAKAGDVDGFSMTLRRGQALVADLEANRRLGSPMDGVMQVVSAAGFVLAQNDDTVGRDPRIIFEAPADGTYIVRLFAFPATPDSSIRFAGAETFIYRLTLTTGGFLDHAFPIAIGRDDSRSVAAVGANIPDAARLLAVPSGDDGREAVRVFHPLLAGTAEVRRVSWPALVEAEPNDPSHPQTIPASCVVSGRIDPPGDRDNFRFVLKKGDRREIRVESRSLGLPLDPILRILDASGKVLAESDDVGENRDPQLSFTAPSDGEYRVDIRDINDRGGPRHAYLLGLLAPEPDFVLSLADDRFEVMTGKTMAVPVRVDRKDEFSGAIEIAAESLPDGVTASPATSRPGDATAKSVTLTLTADGCSHAGPFRIVGKAGNGPTRRTARAAIAGFEAKTDQPWITIRPSADKPPVAPKTGGPGQQSP